ncbi:hypothetical protein GTU79_16875 [Sodalis ligni]|uniref:hypothetical protein n=1 Tax=Sodalis ligni TaxID=2697027 RepID=UPI001BDEC7DA|nr:hypothetical protein [Sodalis ligni]QWA09135.1 hypothetical protein GTU79_16875 [Sodalis ligni]
MKIIEYLYSNKPSELTELSKEEYMAQLVDIPHQMAEKAFEKHGLLEISKLKCIGKGQHTFGLSLLVHLLVILL